ncbi:MAG: hypothetical protein ABR80_02825 [Cryomorphaceae bacterium BACL11 MAG-121015-bin20]|jgi:iron-sulfur cluster assembly protein|nr:MAG: hypothetical protein ABR80_02825 [Cryomorphaceae bacterium BACL11 MAG-121015-bin20]MBC8474311.1 iron-sulfur cluster assembly accessory protein [Cryomorphaceae bacterium]MDA1009121.1 iron-sulfur cluster assembly accessory protein [Bacteroidota bacterium]
MINISNTAKERLFYLLDKDNEKKQFVRVGVESGGCSGLSYKLDFDDKKNDDDELIEDNGIKLLVNKKSFLYLVGTTLEFSDGLNGKGFVFNNPNANRTCGCGESFSL